MSKLVLIKLPGKDQATARKPLPHVTWKAPQNGTSSSEGNDEPVAREPGDRRGDRVNPLPPDYYI